MYGHSRNPFRKADFTLTELIEYRAQYGTSHSELGHARWKEPQFGDTGKRDIQRTRRASGESMVSHLSIVVVLDWRLDSIHRWPS